MNIRNSQKSRPAILNIFKNQFGMNIVGQGGKIILFMLPSLIAAIWVHRSYPNVAALPGSIRFSQPLGYILLVPGLVLWATAVIQLLTGFPKGNLVTTGAYSVVRNPIYSSATFFILPAVALLTQTWVYFVPPLFLYAGVVIFIGVEEKQLLQVFGKEYEDYLAKVDRLIPFAGSFRVAGVVPTRGEGHRGWQHWAPYAAVVWSLLYGAIGIYWAVSGGGFPYGPGTGSDIMGPLLARFGPVVSWTVVLLAGIPAAVMGAAMLRGIRSKTLRPVFITAGVLLAGVLLLFMSGLILLEALGYVPYAIVGLLTGGKMGDVYLEMLAQNKWTIIQQLLCIVGGFIWLAAVVSYARQSADACLYCGRREGPEGWQSPEQARRWGRIAFVVAMVAPVFYAFTRFAWALGFPLGITEEHLRSGQESGIWIAGLFLASFGLLGALLMLGLVQRWGEVFPRWMVGLAGRRVPIALAVIPASLVAVLLVVGGAAIWSALSQMVANLAATGAGDEEIRGAVIFEVGPTLLFPLWGIALAVATLGYYFRRRGSCKVCGRGASNETEELSGVL